MYLWKEKRNGLRFMELSVKICRYLGAKLLLVCYNPLNLFARYRLVHAGHEAEMLASS